MVLSYHQYVLHVCCCTCHNLRNKLNNVNKKVIDRHISCYQHVWNVLKLPLLNNSVVFDIYSMILLNK